MFRSHLAVCCFHTDSHFKNYQTGQTQRARCCFDLELLYLHFTRETNSQLLIFTQNSTLQRNSIFKQGHISCPPLFLHHALLKQSEGVTLYNKPWRCSWELNVVSIGSAANFRVYLELAYLVGPLIGKICRFLVYESRLQNKSEMPNIAALLSRG
jgi:hypothetical protein